jgi:hypothetical protein
MPGLGTREDFKITSFISGLLVLIKDGGSAELWLIY